VVAGAQPHRQGSAAHPWLLIELLSVGACQIIKSSWVYECLPSSETQKSAAHPELLVELLDVGGGRRSLLLVVRVDARAVLGAHIATLQQLRTAQMVRIRRKSPGQPLAAGD